MTRGLLGMTGIFLLIGTVCTHIWTESRSSHSDGRENCMRTLHCAHLMNTYPTLSFTTTEMLSRTGSNETRYNVLPEYHRRYLRYPSLVYTVSARKAFGGSSQSRYLRLARVRHCSSIHEPPPWRKYFGHINSTDQHKQGEATL